MRQVTLAIKLEILVNDNKCWKASAESTFLQLITLKKILTAFLLISWQCYSFFYNYIFYLGKMSMILIVSRYEKALWVNVSGYQRIFFLDVRKHILFLFICLQNCESKRRNFLPSFYNVFWIIVTVGLSCSLQKLS